MFVRYTNIVVLGCAVAAVLAPGGCGPRACRPGRLAGGSGRSCSSAPAWPPSMTCAYGGPLRSGYRPGEVTFSLGAIPANLRYVPAHLIQAMPMLVLGLAAVAGIAARRMQLRQADGEPGRAERRDFAVASALAASWFGVWGLYATYTWTARPGVGTWQTARFYVPATGAIALLGAWLLVRAPRRLAGHARRRWPRRHRPPSSWPCSPSASGPSTTCSIRRIQARRHRLIAISVNRIATSQHLQAGQEGHARRAEESSGGPPGRSGKRGTG